MVLYDPPRWGTCDIDACRGVVWRVNESDAAIRVEVDPPDGHAPGISGSHPVLTKLRERPWRSPGRPR
jgi:hypothetical protein